MSRTLFVGNLSYDTSRAELQEVCEDLGQVLRVTLPADRQSGEHRGFAFVEFGSKAAASQALIALQGTELNGRRLRVSAAKSQPGSASARRRSGFDGRDQDDDGWSSTPEEPPSKRSGRSKAKGGWRDDRHRQHRRGEQRDHSSGGSRFRD